MMSLYQFVLGIQGNSTVKLSTSNKMALRCEMPVTKQTIYLWCLYLMLALILYWGLWALVPFNPCKCPASSCCFQLLISEVSSLQMCTAEPRVVVDQLFSSAICRPRYTGREGSLCAMYNTFSSSTIPFFWCPVYTGFSCQLANCWYVYFSLPYLYVLEAVSSVLFLSVHFMQTYYET